MSTKDKGRALRNEQLFLSGDFDTLYIENEPFIHYFCSKYLNMGYDKEELVSIARLSFCKALKSYNPEVSTFITYLSTVMHMDILYHHRRNKRHLDNAVSLESVIYSGSDGSSITLGETLCDDIDTETICMDSLILHQITKEIQKLKDMERSITTLILSGKTQQEVADTLGISQAHVCRVYKRVLRSLSLKITGSYT